MQNIISSNSGSLTMSSREIAELVDSRHDKVKQSIDRLSDRGVIGVPPVGEYLDSLGRRAKEYWLTKRDSVVVVAQLCPEFTAKIVDRWQELEAMAAKPIDPMQVLNDPASMRSLLLGYTERVIELEAKVEKIQPMADALIRIAHTEGGRCLTDASKVLQIKPREFISKLAQMGWIYKRAGVTNWIGYQDKVNAGYLEHKLTTVERADGSEKSYAQCLVTPKGVAKLSLLFAHKTACDASTAEV